MKRIFVLLLAMVMILGMFPAATLRVHAEEMEERITQEEEVLPAETEETTEADTEETSAPAAEETEPTATVPATEETEPGTTVPESTETEPVTTPEPVETEPATTVPETEPETTVPEAEEIGTSDEQKAGRPVAIIMQPQSVCVAKGETAKATVKATGTGLTYQWYYKNPTAAKYSKSSNTTSTYSVKMSDAVSGRKVYCVVKDGDGNSLKTNVASLDQEVTITTQPKNKCVAKGTTAKTTVKAVGKNLTYQWYYKNPTATKYYKSSNTTASYSVKMSAAVSGRKVYCIVKDSYGNSVKTNVVSLDQEVTITTQPANKCVAKGTTAKTTVKAVGKGLTYQWYYKNPGATKYAKSSNTTATYSVKMSAAVSGRKVYCIVKDSYGNSVKSKVVSLDQKVTIITQPKSTSVAVGETAKVTVKAIGKDLTYKWYYMDYGVISDGRFILESHITGNVYTKVMGPLHDGAQVYCVITDAYGNSVKTKTVTLTVIF